MEPTTNDGYISYLEQRLALAEEQLRRQGVIVTPESPLVNRLQGLEVGSVISWFHRFPRDDVHKYVAFKQKSNEWRLVSGKEKLFFSSSELATNYARYSLSGFKVLS